MKILNAIIAITVLINNSAQATTSMHELNLIQREVRTKLVTYGLPKLGKLDNDYLAQQFFNAGVEMSQEEIFELELWRQSVIDNITALSGGDASYLRKFSLKILYNSMIAGNTDIAETMIDKGVDLGKVDLQALLYDTLQRSMGKEKRVDKKWRDWLLDHGADLNEPMFNLEIADEAVSKDDDKFLDWLWDNSEVTVEQLNKLLPLAVLRGSYDAFSTLLRHGANLDALDTGLMTRATMLKFLLITNRLFEDSPRITYDKMILAENFALYNGLVSSDILNNVLQATAEVSSNYHGSENHDAYIAAMDKLLELGASIDVLDLQKLLKKALKGNVPNRKLAEYLIKHEANINALDLNDLVEIALYNRMYSYTDPKFKDKGIIDAAGFFVLLRELGLDIKQLNLPHLLEKAEEADHMLKQFKGEDAPTTGYVEQLRLLQQD